VQALHPYRCLF